MKKSINSSIYSLVLIGILISCKKDNLVDNSNSTQNQVSNTNNKFELIKNQTGDLHNEFLDNVYNNEKFDVRKSLTESDYENLINYSKTFFLNKGYKLSEINEELGYVNNFKSNCQNSQLAKSSNDNTITSENIILLLDNIKNLFGSNLDENSFANKVNELFLKEMSSNLTDDEKNDVARVCGVAIASHQYWITNIDKWHSSSKATQYSKKEKIGQLVLADMSGAGWGSLLPGAGTAFGAALASGVVAWSWD